jgi:anthranilate synthase/aminodeoxychorismate synthase-like glutamine amidotransferase
MLVIDNYDSFTYNIVQYLKILGQHPVVIKNDELTLEEIKEIQFNRILLSPGWGTPDNAGITMSVIDYYKESKSIFGVCLGMQCIAKYFGDSIINAPEPFHGKNSKIYFDKDFELFKGFKQGFSATRYHSLMVLPNKDKRIQNHIVRYPAYTKDGVLMGLKVDGYKIYGVQFHPEAILTENGIKIFENWLSL